MMRKRRGSRRRRRVYGVGCSAGPRVVVGSMEKVTMARPMEVEMET